MLVIFETTALGSRVSRIQFSFEWSFPDHRVHVHLLADRVAMEFRADSKPDPVLASRKRWDSKSRVAE